MADNTVKTFQGFLGTYHMVDDLDKFEPQRSNNFEVYIDLGGKSTTLTSPSGETFKADAASGWLCLSMDKFSAPQINISTLPIKRGNNTIKYAGTPEFPDSSMSFNDYIGADIEQILLAWQSLVYNVRTQSIGLASSYKKNAWVNQYSPDGTQVRQWEIHGAWLSSLNLGEYSSEDNSVRKVQGTLVYDWAAPVEKLTTSFTNTTSYTP